MAKIALLGVGDESGLLQALPGVFDGPVRADLAREFLRDPRHHMAVATHEGRIIGFASAVHYVHPDKDAELWINEVGIAPDHRRRGLAKRLVGALLQLAADLGCREAWVLTEAHNAAALALYGSLGGVRPPTDPVLFSFQVARPPASLEEDG